MSDDLQAFYGRWARLYDRIARFPGVGTWRAAAADSLALDPGDTVVEMGCGTGANFPYLRERVGSRGTVIGIDLTAGMLAVAARRIAANDWENVHLLRADAARPPISGSVGNAGSGPRSGDDGSRSDESRGVDAVLASFVSGMFAEPASVVERWCSLLDSGGRICLFDAARSTDPRALALDLAFRAFVVASTPPTRKVRYDEPPWGPLETRVETAHDAVKRHCTVHSTERYALGFVRLACGTVDRD